MITIEMVGAYFINHYGEGEAFVKSNLGSFKPLATETKKPLEIVVSPERLAEILLAAVESNARIEIGFEDITLVVR